MAIRFELTSSGKLRLRLEEETDWRFFSGVLQDAEGELAAFLGKEMSEDDLWGELVVPELAAGFEEQRRELFELIQRAQARGRNEIVIGKEEAELWYRVLNHARLNLMVKFDWESKEKPTLGDTQDPEERLAIFREGFYLHLQSLILNYLWDEEV